QDYARPGMRRPAPMSGEMSRGVRPREMQARPGGRPGPARTPNSARVYIGAGRAAGIRPADLVGAIANEAKLGSGQIGGIEIEERFSLVEIPEGSVRDVIEALGRTRIKGQKVVVRLFRD
ncbi:MAG: DbpA RNA binding domain-containing protein, partial [Nitrospira sp.]